MNIFKMELPIYNNQNNLMFLVTRETWIYDKSTPMKQINYCGTIVVVWRKIYSRYIQYAINGTWKLVTNFLKKWIDLLNFSWITKNKRIVTHMLYKLKFLSKYICVSLYSCMSLYRYLECNYVSLMKICMDFIFKHTHKEMILYADNVLSFD